MKFFLACIITLLFVQCSKDDVENKPETCRIDFITYQESPQSGIFTGKFKYNKVGDPVAIIIDKEYTGAPSTYFQYNKNNRLTAFMAAYNVIDNGVEQDTSFAILHQYIYQDDVITGDSIFYMSLLSNKYENPYSVGKYTYDVWGRVIKYQIYNEGQAEPDRTYTYNYPDENPYANNNSVLGTNPILMFVNRDYNKSNSDVLETNEIGLPTKFKVELTNQNYSGGYYFYPNLIFHTVAYSCTK